MKQPRVVFLHYHGIGHINPCLPIAKIVERENYEVHFAGAEFFSQYVASLGYLFYPMKSVPFGLGFEKWVSTLEKKRNLYLATLIKRIKDSLYTVRNAELVKMMDDLNPEIILIDATQVTDFIVLYPHLKSRNIRMGIIHAMFPTHVIPGRPPVNCVAFPEDEKKVNLAVRMLKRKQLKKAWIQKVKFLSFDDEKIISRRIKKNHFPLNYRSKVLSLFNFTTQNVPEFILAPREFDFPDFKTSPTQHYIGFMTNPQHQDPTDSDYRQAFESICDRRTTENLKLIYCSFGTIELEHSEIISTFLNKLINAVDKRGLLLIISMKSHSGSRRKLNKHNNVYVFTSVPQVEVLSNADLFITHGGLSSIKESIHAEIPMLMYPVHADYDPKGNSARVAYHGMGLLGDARKDSEHEISRKINVLLTDPVFKKKVLEMKDKNSFYTAANFLALFNTLSPIQ